MKLNIRMSSPLQYLLIYFLPFILALLLLLKSHFSSSKSNKNLPPCPPKLPIIGNLHQLGSSPHRALKAMAQTYGPLMLLRLGTVQVLVASSVKAAQEILKTHDLIFANRPKLNITSRLTYGSKDIAFSKYGEYWRQIRSIAVLHLLNTKTVESYRQVREDEVALMIKKIHGSANDHSVVNLSELLISVTNNVICRVALGKTYEGKFKGLLQRWVDLLVCFSAGNYIPSLAWVDWLSGLERRADKVAKEFDEFLEGVIEEHINKKIIGDGVDQGQDLVDILLEIQRDNETGFLLERDMIKAIIMDVLAAGTDTTFTALEWAMCELLRYPQAMKKLQQEVREIGQGRSMITEDDLDKMDYLKAVLKEALRLHPPVPLLTIRESSQDVNVLGYDIPSRTQVLINVWAIARDPSNWEEPEEFIPERFLNSSIDYKGSHFEFLPFGAGRRGCPGIQFGVIIDELVLANLVFKFDFALEGDEGLETSETNGLTAHKKRPIFVVPTPYY